VQPRFQLFYSGLLGDVWGGHVRQSMGPRVASAHVREQPAFAGSLFFTFFMCFFIYFTQGPVYAVGFSPDSPFIIAAGGQKGKLTTWNLADHSAVVSQFKERAKSYYE
jgi:WD40 repeat protein